MFGKFQKGLFAVLVSASFFLACGGGGDDQAPTWPADAALQITSLDATSLRVAWPEAQDNEAVTAYRLYREGEVEAELGAATLEHSISNLTPSTSYQLQVQAGDAAGNWSVDGPSLEVTTESGLPPDPALVAPAIDRSVFETFYSRVSFLWAGDEPVVWGADPEAFDARTLVVLRGRVLDEDGQPLSWVDVRIPEHPEYGHTVTREDGRYDLAANGGGRIGLRFSQAGLLPVDRKVLTPWRDYLNVPDVVLIPTDAQGSSVNLDGSGAGAQVALGSLVEDADGARQASLLLPAGARARAVLADGSEQNLDTASLRITEYTLGERGPERMPARMPSNIAYTYAVELGLDEAPEEAEIVFDEPVVFHVDNFLEFPAGTIAPLGYYDRERLVWVPAESGRVISVVGEAQDSVELDSDGDGLADDAAQLAELGIDEAELATLAERFDVGDGFIRLRLAHFSSYDANWGFSPPSDAIAPFRLPTKSGSDRGCEESGSVIDVHNQILGEDIPLVGLPFGLHYRSDRVPGRQAAYSLKIPLVGPEAPASLKGIELEVQVAGQEHDFHFDADPDPSTEVDFHEFTWDGLDAYGRRLQGAQALTVRIGYTYDGVMQANERFGYSGNGTLITGNATRQDVTLWLEWKGSIGALDAKALGLGGWTLGVHHAYDPHGRVLYRGDGTKRSADRLEPVVRTVAGGGTRDPRFEYGLLATKAKIGCVDVAVGPDGSLYFVESTGHRVRRIDLSGSMA